LFNLATIFVLVGFPILGHLSGSNTVALTNSQHNWETFALEVLALIALLGVGIAVVKGIRRRE
jgi:hypothetical protein